MPKSEKRYSLNQGYLFKWANRGLFLVYFCSFQTQNFTEKTVGVCGIRTRIVRVEGEHADHLTTTVIKLNILVAVVAVSVTRSNIFLVFLPLCVPPAEQAPILWRHLTLYFKGHLYLTNRVYRGILEGVRF